MLRILVYISRVQFFVLKKKSSLINIFPNQDLNNNQINTRFVCTYLYAFSLLLNYGKEKKNSTQNSTKVEKLAQSLACYLHLTSAQKGLNRCRENSGNRCEVLQCFQVCNSGHEFCRLHYICIKSTLFKELGVFIQ